MARPRSPNRDKAFKLYEEHKGNIDLVDIAKTLEISPGTVRGWKNKDKWDDKLNGTFQKDKQPKRKRGGQIGNKNAKGNGAPPKNKNAETHGAYSKIYLSDLTEEERKYIESITLDPTTNMLVELQQLMAKENDLKKKIATFESKGNVMHVDRVVEVIMPKEKDKDKEKEPMRTVVKVSSFDRVMKLESELNKVRGRILKLIDSIKSYELECKRITLEEKKYKLMKQRVTGAYEIDPEIGDIDDVYEEYEDKG